jgi:hypothetical protein
MFLGSSSYTHDPFPGGVGTGTPPLEKWANPAKCTGKASPEKKEFHQGSGKNAPLTASSALLL